MKQSWFVAVALVACGSLSSCARKTAGDRIAVFTKNQTNP